MNWESIKETNKEFFNVIFIISFVVLSMVTSVYLLIISIWFVLLFFPLFWFAIHYSNNQNKRDIL